MCNLSQGAVFCLANIFVQAAVNGLGETAMAGLFTSDVHVVEAAGLRNNADTSI